MKKIILLFVLITMSCDNARKEYYPDGSISKKFYLKDNLLDGSYFEYYKDGKIKLKHSYFEGSKIDTSYYYDESGSLREKRVWMNDSIKVLLFKNNQIIVKGKLDSNKNKIGFWKFYGKETDSIVEKIIVNDNSFDNRFWVLDKTGDTIWSRSNNFKLFLNKKEVNLKEQARIRLVLTDPYFHSLSDVKVLLFDKESDPINKNDFINDIGHETFYSLKNDGIEHPEIPSYINQNHLVEFALEFSSPGKKYIRGILREYTKGIVNTDSLSVKMFQRDMYFHTEIYVKENIKSASDSTDL